MSQSVVFYLSNFKSGGTEWFALRLARGFAQRGLRPVFLVADPTGELLPAVQQSFEIVSLSGSDYSLRGLMKTIPAMVRFLRAQRPEVVISGLPLLHVVLTVAVKLSGTHPRLLMVEHMRQTSERSDTRRVRAWVKRFALRAAYQRADEVIAVSHVAARDLEQELAFPGERVKVIYNPVIPETFEALCAERPLHPWLYEKTRPVLLAVGRLLAVKDYPTLLRAFADVRKMKPLRLLILGEGGERLRLEALIQALGLEDCVALPGSTPNVFSAMKAADLFVLSSTSESFGNVVAEALACGTPVVSTDCGGPREILEDGLYGTLVPPGDPNRLAVALLAALEQKPDRATLEARGRFFSVEAAVERYLALIDGCVF